MKRSSRTCTEGEDDAAVNGRILVIAAHPDDELLGCGATVCKRVAMGDEAHVLILCEGETMRSQSHAVKRLATLSAAKILGTAEPVCAGLPDQHLDAIPIVDVIRPIEEMVERVQPGMVLCPFGADLNRDHQLVYEAAMVSLRPKFASVEEIYAYYTVGSTEYATARVFRPDMYECFDQATLRRKLEAFACYEMEALRYPNPRSAEGLTNLARFFGNQCCSEYAEAFETVRRIAR